MYEVGLCLSCALRALTYEQMDGMQAAQMEIEKCLDANSCFVLGQKLKEHIAVQEGPMNIVCIVPARGGSKRIPDKNIKNLCGRPLIFYTLEEALKSRFVNRVYVTTESEKVKEK